MTMLSKNFFKKTICITSLFMVGFSSVFASDLLNQKVDVSGGDLVIKQGELSMSIPSGTFASAVNLQVRDGNSLEGTPDVTKFQDVKKGVFVISATDTGGKNVNIINKDVLLTLQDASIKNPVLFRSNSGALTQIDGVNNAGIYVFTLTGTLNGNYQFFSNLISSTGSETGGIDLLGGTATTTTNTNITPNTTNNGNELLGNTSINTENSGTLLSSGTILTGSGEELNNISPQDRPKGGNTIVIMLSILSVLTLAGISLYKKA